LRAAVGREFAFEQAAAAYAYLAQGRHFRNVVIEIGDND
jgi:hypothetical protein